MRLSPLFDQQLEAAQLSGLERGRKQTITALLETRFGTLDEELTNCLDSMLRLSPNELMPLLMQLSREEIIDRFRG